MRPPDEAKRELVGRWFEKAERDFDLAYHLVAEDCSYREAIAFHSQQAGEKFLKAYLVLHQIDFPRTHNLGELLDLVASRDAPMADLLRDITTLNPYGVEYRYPGDFPDLTREDAEHAFRLAEKVRAAVLPKLPSGLESTHPAT
jgi:HEPN domain-containing protein